MSNPWVKHVGILLAVVVVAVVGWRVLSHGKVAKVSYEFAEVDKGTVEKSISSTGSVAALVTVDVGSQISGQISELKADFDSQVKKGDLLAVIDPQTYQQRMNSAQADLSVAYASLGTQQANLRKAQTTLDQNRRDYERSKQLAESKLISQSALEDSRKAVALSESDLAIAEAQIKNAEALVQTRKASLEQAPHRPVAHADTLAHRWRSHPAFHRPGPDRRGQPAGAGAVQDRAGSFADPHRGQVGTRPTSARSSRKTRPPSPSMPSPSRRSAAAWHRCAWPPPRCRTWSRTR